MLPYGVYFVDINAILNYPVYKDTISKCGTDGSLCGTINAAPVCQAINHGNLIPGTNVYSAFSFDCVPTNGIGQTNCSRAPYAGCMTAPCFATDRTGIVECSCPVFNGPSQVGQNDQACTLGGDLVWSAAYAHQRRRPRPPHPHLPLTPLRRLFPVQEPACPTRQEPSDARCMRLDTPLCRPAAALTAQWSAKSTADACKREEFRPDLPAMQHFAPTNATTGTW
jgi:hypothetical protein